MQKEEMMDIHKFQMELLILEMVAQVDIVQVGVVEGQEL
jgi:hypothetical protein